MVTLPLLLLSGLPAFASPPGDLAGLLAARASIHAPDRELGLSPAPMRSRCAQSWRGTVEGIHVRMDLRLFERAAGRLEEPELVVEMLRTTRRAPSWGCSRMPREEYERSLYDPEEDPMHEFGPERARPRFGPGAVWSGPFGSVPRAGVVRGPTFRKDPDETVGWRLAVGGLLPGQAWLLEIDFAPKPSDRQIAVFEEQVRYGTWIEVPRRAERWSDPELLARWETLVGADGPPLRNLARTEHFVVLGDADFGPPLLRAVERDYRSIRAALPFEERSGQRDLPIFLFRQRATYTRAIDQPGTLGLAWWDACATWYREPGDPVLAHEIAHQLVRNRLFLVGGTSWLKEGLADALARPEYDLRDTARALARSGFNLPWAKSSGSWEARTVSYHPAFHAYDGAATALDFLRRDPRTRDRFEAFVRRAAESSPRDAEQCQRAAREVFGASLEELEARWWEEQATASQRRQREREGRRRPGARP